jgi:mutator mutT protein
VTAELDSSLTKASSAVKVAVGVVFNSAGDVLIARRTNTDHLAGYWEFPGGKIESGETATVALARELAEEVGIRVEHCRPLLTISHQYAEKFVVLDVRRVDAFSGEAVGLEGQEVRWVKPAELLQYQLPEANKPIVTAVSLPSQMLITGVFVNEQDLLNKCISATDHGFSHIQFRAPWLPPQKYVELLKLLDRELRPRGVKVFANTNFQLWGMFDYPYKHLSSHRLLQFSKDQLRQTELISASCHNLQELQSAEKLGVDFVYFSPVKFTRSHPHAEPAGWQALIDFCAEATVPVYALGGLGSDDLVQAQASGAQGVASISAYWR